MAALEETVILKGILDSYPYPIVFVDDGFVIRYLNRYARYHYYEERGYSDLTGKSLFDCHDRASSRERREKAFEKMKSDGKEVLVSVSARNQRVYMQPVRDGAGKLIGFFERFELNLCLGQQR